MAFYTFPAFVAVDPTNPQNVVSMGVGQLYAATDTGRLAPLPITDLNGMTLTELAANDIGLVPAFRCDCDGTAVWGSGSYNVPLMAPAAILEMAQSAAASAASAIVSAVPIGGAAGQVLSKAGGSDYDTTWTTPQQFVIIGPTDDWPTGLPEGTIVVRTEV